MCARARFHSTASNISTDKLLRVYACARFHTTLLQLNSARERERLDEHSASRDHRRGDCGCHRLRELDVRDLRVIVRPSVYVEDSLPCSSTHTHTYYYISTRCSRPSRLFRQYAVSAQCCAARSVRRSCGWQYSASAQCWASIKSIPVANICERAILMGFSRARAHHTKFVPSTPSTACGTSV